MDTMQAVKPPTNKQIAKVQDLAAGCGTNGLEKLTNIYLDNLDDATASGNWALVAEVKQDLECVRIIRAHRKGVAS